MRKSDVRLDPVKRQRALDIYNTEGKHIELAKKFGVSEGLVREIKTGKVWSTVTGHDKNQGKKVKTPVLPKWKTHIASTLVDARPGTEPWQHLDIPVKEKLKMAISEYFK